MNIALIPYLNLDGNVADAMRFYHSIFGGELTMQTFADAFPETPAAWRERIMHAQLKSDALTIMASDTHPEHSVPLVAGNSVHLSLVGSDAETLTRYFSALAEGCVIGMPLEKQFWGDTFGTFTDRYGIHWMVNISAPAE